MPKLALVFFVGLSLLLVGCSLIDSPISSDDETPVNIQASLTNLSVEEQYQAQVIFTRGRHTFQEIVPIVNNDINLSIMVPVGTWDIQMIILDEEEIPRFQDSLSGITVFPDNPTFVEMHLIPADGILSITIELANYPQQDQVERARIHFNDTHEEVIFAELEEPWQVQYPLAPGSYDFKIELFTESFRATDKIYPGVWHSLSIEPEIEKQIFWEPITENLEIVAEIGLVPACPTNLQVEIDQPQVYLTWDAPASDDLLGYLVYWQPDPYERFELLTPVPIQTLNYTHSIDDETIRQVKYTTAAVSTAGQVGYRSEVLTIQLSD